MNRRHFTARKGKDEYKTILTEIYIGNGKHEIVVVVLTEIYIVVNGLNPGVSVVRVV